jgi:hypothetical protein
MLENQFHTKPATKLEVIFSKVEGIARNTRLVVRKSRRFTAAAFLLTLLKTVATGKASYNQMASTLGHCDLRPMSRQAFSQRMGEKSEHFIKETLSEAMVQKWGGKKIIKTQYFVRILVEDSSQYKMHKKNNAEFPGHGNSKSDSSGCKIDLSFDLLTGCPLLQILDRATAQDKTLGKKLVDMVQPKDLVLRDMGYFIVNEFRLIEARDAFWLSRMPANVCAFMEDGRTLDECLKSFKGKELDKPVNLLNEKGHRVRLIAIRAEKQVAEKRRRDRIKSAKKNGKTPSKKSLLRDGWHIMVTNVDKGKMDAEDLVKLYSLRWQIEITFRAWKQSGELMKALNRNSKPTHLRTLIYASILWLVISMKTAATLQSGLNKNEQVVSLEKLAMSIIGYIMKLTVFDDLSKYTPHLRHVLIESRKRDSLMAVGIQCLS